MFGKAQSSLSVCASIPTVSALDVTSNPYLNNAGQRADAEIRQGSVLRIRLGSSVIGPSRIRVIGCTGSFRYATFRSCDGLIIRDASHRRPHGEC